MKEIRPGMYEHYKGNRYEMIGIAKYSKTLEEIGGLSCLGMEKGKRWVKPLKCSSKKLQQKKRKFYDLNRIIAQVGIPR